MLMVLTGWRFFDRMDRIWEGLAECLFDEGDAFGIDLFGGGEEVAPDAGGGGEVGEGTAEGFDGHPAVVTDFLEVLDLFGDVDVATTRGAAVVFGDVNVIEFAGGEYGVDGGEGILFFDVGVEGVVHGAEVGVIDALHVGGGLIHGVEEVSFEAVEGFDGAFDASGFGNRSDGAVDAGCAVEFGFGGVGAGELAEDLIVGAAEGWHAGVVGAVEDALEVVDGALAIGGVGADGVVGFVGEDGDGGGFKAVVLEDLADVFEVVGAADVEDGDFDTVVASGFEFFDDGKVFFGHMTGPEEEVKSDFH